MIWRICLPLLTVNSAALQQTLTMASLAKADQIAELMTAKAI
jgi:hypothetical protein